MPPLGEQQHPPPAQLEQVGALPDVRRDDLRRHRVVDGEQRTDVRPVVQVVAAVEQQLRVAGRVPGALHRIPVTSEPEHERIPHLGDGRVVGRLDLDLRILAPLAQRPVTPGDGHPSVPGVLADGGVDRGRHPAVVHHAAGPAAVAVRRPRDRGQRDRLVAPPQEVRGAHVSPVDVAVGRPVRVVLVEDVVAVVDPTDPVRVVQPAAERHDVQARASGDHGVIVEAAGGARQVARVLTVGDDAGPPDGESARGPWAGAGCRCRSGAGERVVRRQAADR